MSLETRTRPTDGSYSESKLNKASSNYPSIGPIDLLQLFGMCVGGFTRTPRSFDFGLTLQEWIGELSHSNGSENVLLDLYLKKFLVVTVRELSEHILAEPPDTRSYMEGTTKARAMSFLAPQAPTIAHGEQWLRLRRFN